MRNILLSVAATALIISLMLISSIGKITKLAKVEAIDVSVCDITGSILCSGKIESSYENDIYTDTAIKVTSVNVEIGDRVKKGDLLFTAETVNRPITDTGKEISEIIGKDFTENDVISAFNELLGGSQGSAKTSSHYSADDDQYNVVSPIDGVVSSLNVTTDSTVASSVSCLTVMDPAALQVRAAVTESLIKDVSVGMRCKVSGSGFNGTYLGTVERIMPYARQTQTLTGAGETVVDIIITLEAPRDELIPGFGVDVDLLSNDKEAAVLVPYECILQDKENREFVYVVYNDYILKRYIKIGYELDDAAEIISGLQAGEKVVINPNNNLIDGEKVEVASYEIS